LYQLLVLTALTLTAAAATVPEQHGSKILCCSQPLQPCHIQSLCNMHTVTTIDTSVEFVLILITTIIISCMIIIYANITIVSVFNMIVVIIIISVILLLLLRDLLQSLCHLGHLTAHLLQSGF